MDATEIKAYLENAIAEPMVEIQVVRPSLSQLVVTFNREMSDPIDYITLGERATAALLTLKLPDLQEVRFYGRIKGESKPEWQLRQSLQEKAKAISFTGNWLALLDRFKDRIITISLLGILAMQVSAVFLGQKKAPEAWEYRIESIPDILFTTTMNDYGENGWELVFARRATDDTDVFFYECIFKRRLRK